MDKTTLTSAASRFVDAFDSTAHTAIEACRKGGARLGDAAGERWERTFEQASGRLTPETRRNADRASEVLAKCYWKGLQMSTDGAQTVVDTLVKVADSAIERAAASKSTRG